MCRAGPWVTLDSPPQLHLQSQNCSTLRLNPAFHRCKPKTESQVRLPSCPVEKQEPDIQAGINTQTLEDVLFTALLKSRCSFFFSGCFCHRVQLGEILRGSRGTWSRTDRQNTQRRQIAELGRRVGGVRANEGAPFWKLGLAWGQGLDNVWCLWRKAFWEHHRVRPLSSGRHMSYKVFQRLGLAGSGHKGL